MSYPPGIERLLRRKATWQMTDGEMARVVGHFLGWNFGSMASNGGWIYTEQGHAVGQGWERVARAMVEAKWILPGRGINWQRIERSPVSLVFVGPANGTGRQF